LAGLARTGSGALVAVSTAASGQSATPPRLWLLDGSGGARDAFPELDIEVERATVGDSRPRGASRLLAAGPGPDEVLFLATVGTDVALHRGDLGAGTATRLSDPGTTVTDFSPAAGDRVAVCVESPTTPVELKLLDLTTGAELAATGLNSAWVTAAEPVRPEPFTVDELDGLLYRAEESVGPLVVRVHGGPHMAFGSSFDLESQLLVSAGYRVLLPTRRGGAGRGATFRAASVDEWGRADLTELLAFADAAVERAVADPDRLYLAGGSYGGYLINWTLTRTDRFRAAISERSIANLLSKYGTSDNGSTVNRYEFGGVDLFDEDSAQLWERSPLRHAANIRTPVLLLHGENDHRCPIEQSEQLFTALRRLGREARFVRFPGESHGLAVAGRPDRRLTRLELILDWLRDHG
jgi:dipeptidyl aminopeptidase/acylaminoacyl peptidase